MEIIDAATQQKVMPVIDMPAFQHNGTSFQILNGNWLEGYPLKKTTDEIDSGLQLDTTGQYISIGKCQSPKQEPYPRGKIVKSFIETLSCSGIAAT